MVLGNIKYPMQEHQDLMVRRNLKFENSSFLLKNQIGCCMSVPHSQWILIETLLERHLPSQKLAQSDYKISDKKRKKFDLKIKDLD